MLNLSCLPSGVTHSRLARSVFRNRLTSSVHARYFHHPYSRVKIIVKLGGNTADSAFSRSTEGRAMPGGGGCGGGDTSEHATSITDNMRSSRRIVGSTLFGHQIWCNGRSPWNDGSADFDGMEAAESARCGFPATRAPDRRRMNALPVDHFQSGVVVNFRAASPFALCATVDNLRVIPSVSSLACQPKLASARLPSTRCARSGHSPRLKYGVGLP